jgi:DNA-directed RNA polymerase specialized sigma24 family protein
MKRASFDGKPSSAPASDRFFPQTSLTLVGAAARREARALNEFIERYYSGVRTFIATIVKDSELAEELTHEFFEARIIDSSRVLDSANPDRGRFRDLLKAALRHFVIDRHYRPQEKRLRSELRPDAQPGMWDAVALETNFEEADHALFRGWGESLIKQALIRTQERCEKRRQHVHFEMFKRRFVDDPDCPPSFREIGSSFSLDEKTARSRIMTVVGHFRTELLELLRTEGGIAGRPEDELRELLALL